MIRKVSSIQNSGERPTPFNLPLQRTESDKRRWESEEKLQISYWCSEQQKKRKCNKQDTNVLKL